MDPLRSEEEQLEALKQWWEENGKTTIAAIALVVAGWFGWNYWQNQEQMHRESGSASFAQLQALAATQELSDVQRASLETLAQQLETEYADLGYATLAKLEMAKFYANQGDMFKAEELLSALDLETVRPEIAKAARLRLARAQWANGSPEAALATLDSGEAGSFESLYEELRGDIAFSLGDRALARDKYLAAIDAIVVDESNSAAVQRLAFLQMKADSLQVVESASVETEETVEAPETETAAEDAEG